MIRIINLHIIYLKNGFKDNNFQNEEDFEDYIKTNFFDKNVFEYGEFDEENNSYMVKISDRTGISSEQVEKNFTVVLKERNRV